MRPADAGAIRPDDDPTRTPVSDRKSPRREPTSTEPMSSRKRRTSDADGGLGLAGAKRRKWRCEVRHPKHDGDRHETEWSEVHVAHRASVTVAYLWQWYFRERDERLDVGSITGSRTAVRVRSLNPRGTRQPNSSDTRSGGNEAGLKWSVS